jgi:hypothetical protein
MIINKKPDGSKYDRSILEKRFETIWESFFPDIDLIVEVSLVPQRRFRVDYLHESSRVTIEINGGQFMRQGGHSSSSGKLKDAEKQNLLVVNNYKPFVLWTTAVNSENIKLIGDYIQKQSK